MNTHVVCYDQFDQITVRYYRYRLPRVLLAQPLERIDRPHLCYPKCFAIWEPYPAGCRLDSTPQLPLCQLSTSPRKLIVESFWMSLTAEGV